MKVLITYYTDEDNGDECFSLLRMHSAISAISATIPSKAHGEKGASSAWRPRSSAEANQ